MDITAPLVLNWHLTEPCNYSCKYCYAAWVKSGNDQELIRDYERTVLLLNELYQFFRPGNPSHPMAKERTWSSVRLNLAGGEPLLHSAKLPAVIRYARELGFEVSLITNGSHLNDELLGLLAPELTWLGISIDSANAATNRAIGRIDNRGQMLSLQNLATILGGARKANSAMRLKVNTVVNQLNHDEDLSSLIQHFAPEKWKVLRMLPVVSQNLAVSDEQFSQFVDRHQSLSHVLCAEDNQDMRDSYLMIDPHGRFFQNSPIRAGQGYVYSQPIIDVGAQKAFAEIAFNHDRFNARYIPIAVEMGT